MIASGLVLLACAWPAAALLRKAMVLYLAAKSAQRRAARMLAAVEAERKVNERLKAEAASERISAEFERREAAWLLTEAKKTQAGARRASREDQYEMGRVLDLRLWPKA